MLREAMERFRQYFYEYPGNPIELTDGETEVKGIIPKKEDVVEGRKDPITTKELKEKAEKDLSITGRTARNKAYSLKDKGVVDKISKKEWVKTGRFRKLSESKLKNLFVVVSIIFLGASLRVGNPWPLYMATFLLVISVILFW